MLGKVLMLFYVEKHRTKCILKEIAFSLQIESITNHSEVQSLPKLNRSQVFRVCSWLFTFYYNFKGEEDYSFREISSFAKLFCQQLIPNFIVIFIIIIFVLFVILFYLFIHYYLFYLFVYLFIYLFSIAATIIYFPSKFITNRVNNFLPCLGFLKFTTKYVLPCEWCTEYISTL